MAVRPQTPRKAVRDHYDAYVSLDPHTDAATLTFAAVKFTYAVSHHGLEPAAAIPLVMDTAHVTDVRLFDLGLTKNRTDVLLHGNARPPAGRSACRQTEVSISIGTAKKHAIVFGRRFAEPHGNTFRFTEPSPFEELPLSRVNAYGGEDRRFRVEEARASHGAPGQLKSMNPYEYPRNPAGRGYIIGTVPSEPIELPNLEDPAQLLTPDSLLVPRPEDWYRQPLPWSFDRLPETVFARYARSGGQPWFPAPIDVELEEVKRRYLPAKWHQQMEGRKPPSAFPSVDQEASLGLALPFLGAATKIVVTGASERPFEFELPPPPKLQLQVEAHREQVEALLTGLIIQTTTRIVTLTYIATTKRVPRAFRPGFHSFIPLAVSVNEDRPIMYEERPRRGRVLENSPPGFVVSTERAMEWNDEEAAPTGEELPEEKTTQFDASTLTDDAPAFEAEPGFESIATRIVGIGGTANNAKSEAGEEQARSRGVDSPDPDEEDPRFIDEPTQEYHPSEKPKG